MKTIEQKAKAYDEAIERAKKHCADYIVETIFPELKESEDEKIRNQIIEHIKWSYDEQECAEEEMQRWISWLESQAEHAKFRDSIQIGDKVTRNQDGVLVNLSQLNRVAKKDEKQGEQKPTDKVEPKFKVGDVIRLKGSAAEYTIKRVTDTTYYTDGWSCSIERCEEDYELVEQKSVWSEEDEKLYKSALWHIKNSCGNGGKNSGEFEVYNWLKSLKYRIQPQSHWKPSDEQMVALQEAMNIVGILTITGSKINSLYQDLKKLKG